jgi:hypothetical protein
MMSREPIRSTPAHNAKEMLRRLKAGELDLFPAQRPFVYYTSKEREPELRRLLGMDHHEEGQQG